jgi:transposase
VSAGSLGSPQGKSEDKEDSGEVKVNRKNWEGKYSYEDYAGAQTHYLKVEGVKSGDCCNSCFKGRLYKGEDLKLLEFTGSAPVTVTRYKKEVLRCNACGATVRNNQEIKKWHNSARSSIILQKTHGMPFYRLACLQTLSGTPVAPSTSWQQCYDVWQEAGMYIYKELLTLAAKSKTLHMDDTRARILEVIKAKVDSPEEKHRACNTTVICAKTLKDESIILYITNSTHGGENLTKLLEGRHRDDKLKLMTDASNYNKSATSDEIIHAYCLAHGQRKYSEIEKYYPEECKYFLSQTRAIYHNEHKVLDCSERERFEYHKKYSSIHIDNIYNKIEELFKNKIIEPNSLLGKAMRYWVNNKDGLTRFLEVEGISLDNNLSERSLKGIILARKNSLFFKTKNSAQILSELHSIVQTCKENSINSFGYLNWIQDNWLKVQKEPQNYLPFAYAESIKVAA